MPRDPRALAKALIAASRERSTVADSGMGGFAATGPSTSPLVQSYAAWTSGSLPRDPATFLTGSFGPLSPMQPMPIDQPNPDTDRVDPRRWQYTPGWNVPHGTPGDEGLKLASFANLRTIGDTYSVARACIQLRKDELLGLGWDVVPTKAAEKAMRGDAAKRKEFDQRRAKMVTFWKRPDHQYFSFRDWFSVLLEDVLVVDALSLYLWPARAKGKGVLGSNLAQLAAIDGSTIRPLLDVHGGTPLPPNPGFQQYLYGVPRSDLVTMHAGEDIAGMGDALTREYQADQLIYRPNTPRNWTPYGFAPIERALVPILSGIQRQQFQLNYFSEGSIPGLFVSAGDPNATPSQLRELQDALNAMAGDPGWKHKIIVLPQGSRTDPQRPAELAGTFDEIIMTQVCMAFSVMPMELGISPRTSSTQSSGAANQMAKTSQTTQERKGNVPLLEWFADIFNHVIQGVCGQEDMQWWWEGLEQGEDEEKKVNVQKAKIATGLMSIDEGRVEDGKQPWGLPTTSDPVLITATGVIPFGSIDPKTGLPVGHPEQMPPGGPQGPAGGAVPAGGPTPPPKPKPAPAGGTAGRAPTPAHAGAQANAATTATASKPTPAGDPKAVEKKVDTFAALRELDLLRRRIVKGRGLDGWTVEHIPDDLFDTLDGTTVSIERVRTAVKGIGLRQRREEATAAGRAAVANGLRRLADGLSGGEVAAPEFIDAAVQVLRTGIRSGLGAGASHALGDLGQAQPVRKYAAAPASYDSRFFQYAEAVKSGYEAGRGLTTVASGDGKWTARWDATSARPCDLCKARNGTTYEIGEIPGYPGMGGFGPSATICRGGTNCKCEITYIHTPDADPSPQPDQVAAKRALAAGPDAYEAFLDDRAEAMAEQQRPYLMRLLRDLLTAGSVTVTPLAFPAGAATIATAGTLPLLDEQMDSQYEAAPVTKHEGHADRTHEVYAYLARQYPASVLEWVKDAHWHAPQEVRLADIDMDRRPGGARDETKVGSIEAALDQGHDVHPIVLVRTPEGLPYRIADGFHRTLALRHAGRSAVRAYIGDVDTTNGPWGAQMNRAKLTKSAAGPNAAGLAVQAKDTGRVLMLQRAVDPADRASGMWEFPGGRLDAGEDAETAARREFTEETGLEVPDGKITGTWTSPNGVYIGFVLRVKHESDVDIFGDRDATVNPDDPDGDNVEALAWWDPRQLDHNPAVRTELADSLAHVLYVLHPPVVEKGHSLEVFKAAYAALKVDEGAAGDYRARHLIRWFEHGEGAARIAWGTPGDFDRCVTIASEHMTTEQAKGFCNLRHHGALGIYPATHAAMERRAEGKVAEPDVVKVGPKGYIHGWIFVGAPGVGDAVHHPKHGRGTVTHHDEHGHVHVRFDSGQRRSFGTAGEGKGGLTRRSEASNDEFTKHLKAAAAANRRGDHAAAAEHYRRAAEAASHPKIKQEMLDRAKRDAAKVEPVEPAKPAHAVQLRPETHAAVRAAHSALPKSREEWDGLFRKEIEGGPKRAIDQRVIDLKQDLDSDQIALDQAKEMLQRETERITNSLKRRGVSPRTNAYKQEVADYVRPHQQEVERAERNVNRSRVFYENMKEAAEDDTILDSMGAVSAAALRRKLAPKYESLYPKDARDYRMPPAELKAHHERVMAAGKAIREDLQKAFDTDPQISEIAARLNKLHDKEGFTAGKTMQDKIANRREIARLKIEQRRRQKELVHDALGQLRPFGGATHADVQAATDADIARMPGSWRDQGMEAQRARADWREQLTHGEQHFPKDWITTSSGKPLDVISSHRAFHIEGYGRPGATVLAMNTDAGEPGVYDGAFGTKIQEITVHEMGHRMEVTIPGLTALEFAYVRSKTTDAHGNVEMPTKLKDLYGGSYSDREITFKDEFPNAYTGKTYERGGKDSDPASRAWEAFQVGLQDVYGRSTSRYGDESLQHFTLGVLATLHRLEES